ncbi:MAG: acylneuraminate cytidylyltransferase family protein [Candidatus Margulisbacteria bacterium]|nr:acylneuraminate cytidylyltransferase family protein [Candidatus Margulisiibacteriota bacterium]
MYNNKSIVALIPARGGSKGLPGKNIRSLAGKPLIAWTIDAALDSKYIDRVIVSTDDEKIADTARQYKADVPFVRPQELATDSATGTDVALHTLNWLKENDKNYDALILLQPTSPLRSVEDIDDLIQQFFLNSSAKALVSVCEAHHHPLWANTLPSDLNMRDFIRPEIKNKNRQDLPVYYQLNGALYIASPDYILNVKSFLGPETYAYIMPAERSVDIDDLSDFFLVENLLKNR